MLRQGKLRSNGRLVSALVWRRRQRTEQSGARGGRTGPGPATLSVRER